MIKLFPNFGSCFHGFMIDFISYFRNYLNYFYLLRIIRVNQCNLADKDRSVAKMLYRLVIFNDHVMDFQKDQTLLPPLPLPLSL